MEKFRTVDIIIPSYNNRDEALRCLEGFNNQTEKDFRVLFCVDGSTDDTVSSVKSLSLNYELVLLEHPDKKNHGRNAARNLALPHLSSEYCVLLDSDFIPDRNFITAHLNVLRQGGVVSVGNIEYLNRRENMWGDYLMSRGHHKFKPGSEIPFYYFLTGNSALPTAWLLSLDGFDSALKTYGGNDLEISWRIKREFSPRTIYNAEAKAKGYMNKSLAFALEQISEFGAVNLPYIRRKHPEFVEMFNYETLMSNSWWSGLLWSDFWERLISVSLKWKPRPVRRMVIHYLTAKYLRLGYMTGRKKEATLFAKIT